MGKLIPFSDIDAIIDYLKELRRQDALKIVMVAIARQDDNGVESFVAGNGLWLEKAGLAAMTVDHVMRRMNEGGE